jgi:hypothetical protein
MSFIPALNQIIAGNSDDPSRDMSNWNNIVNIVNGQLGNVNFGTTDVLAISKTALGTYTAPATWTSNPSGWTGAVTTVARYSQIGKWVNVVLSFVGTSNQTYATFALPVASNQTIAVPIARAMDNDVYLNGNPWMQLTAGSTTVTCYSTGAGGVWTAALGKYIYAAFGYEVA